LRDLGICLFLIADSLIGVVSQRLVRKICKGCKTAYKPAAWEKEYLHEPGLELLFRGKGCEVCNGLGYLGRTLVYELLTVDQGLAQMIDKDAEASVLKEAAAANGFEDIFYVTKRKVLEGITTTEEALRMLGHIRQV
jgi:type II secretory ATPase GspE/PulE/Tfp pilus assembly ATPase PilB-like protein